MREMFELDLERLGFEKMRLLEDKLKESEMERMKLEMKFESIIAALKQEEEARLKYMQEKYEIFLAECEQRRKRNDDILKSLEKIEYGAKIIHGKSERLRQLRNHYDAYLSRVKPLWRYPDIDSTPIDFTQQKPFRERIEEDNRPALYNDKIPGPPEYYILLNRPPSQPAIKYHLPKMLNLEKVQSPKKFFSENIRCDTTFLPFSKTTVPLTSRDPTEYSTTVLNKQKFEPHVRHFETPSPSRNASYPVNESSLRSPNKSVKDSELADILKNYYESKKSLDLLIRDQVNVAVEEKLKDVTSKWSKADEKVIDTKKKNLRNDLEISSPKKSQSTLNSSPKIIPTAESPVNDVVASQINFNTKNDKEEADSKITPLMERTIVAHQRSIEELKEQLNSLEDVAEEEDIPEEFIEEVPKDTSRYETDVMRKVILEEEEPEDPEEWPPRRDKSFAQQVRKVLSARYQSEERSSYQEPQQETSGKNDRSFDVIATPDKNPRYEIASDYDIVGRTDENSMQYYGEEIQGYPYPGQMYTEHPYEENLNTSQDANDPNYIQSAENYYQDQYPIENYPYDGHDVENKPQEYYEYGEPQYAQYEEYEQHQEQQVADAHQYLESQSDADATAPVRIESEALITASPNRRNGSNDNDSSRGNKRSVFHQLLDSDSESYKIEPSGPVEADSDFDFSSGK